MIALRERNFRLYWLGQAISNIGNWMQVVALGWFILQLTGSPIALGMLGLAQFLPVLLLSLAGGILADRFLRLHLLMVTQSAAMALAFILTILALMGKPPLWSLLLIAALSAAVTAIDNPARQAFLSDLVGKDLLLSAVALNASVYNGAAVIGPSLAGLVLLRVGAAGCFLLNAFSFLAVLIALAVISI
ncbi:MAG TPA: MFS transporter, partial [Ktedonobacteraceae bacterium]|nr:MFS transporter [Ktedonobacteraceae bacterium]